eukprot:Rmarinus@m.22980
MGLPASMKPASAPQAFPELAVARAMESVLRILTVLRATVIASMECANAIKGSSGNSVRTAMVRVRITSTVCTASVWTGCASVFRASPGSPARKARVTAKTVLTLSSIPVRTEARALTVSASAQPVSTDTTARKAMVPALPSSIAPLTATVLRKKAFVSAPAIPLA